MSSSRHSCYHSWMNPLAVLAVLLLVAMTTMQTISPVNATIEGQEESLGHPEMVGETPFATCKNQCLQTYDGHFFKDPLAPWNSQTIGCLNTKMVTNTCLLWCDKCAHDYGRGFHKHTGSKFQTVSGWSKQNGICDCYIHSYPKMAETSTQ
eukprot:Nk52_evm1s1451 gene=Nk52_evmTU1s1451